MWPQIPLLLPQVLKGLPRALPLPRRTFLSWYYARPPAASLTSLRAEALGKEEAASEPGTPLLGWQSPGKPPAPRASGSRSCSSSCGSPALQPLPPAEQVPPSPECERRAGRGVGLRFAGGQWGWVLGPRPTQARDTNQGCSHYQNPQIFSNPYPGPSPHTCQPSLTLSDTRNISIISMQPQP